MTNSRGMYYAHKAMIFGILMLTVSSLIGCSKDTDGIESMTETSMDTSSVLLSDRDTADARYIANVSSYQFDELSDGYMLTRFGTASFTRGQRYYAEMENGYHVYDSNADLLYKLSFPTANKEKMLTFSCTENEEFLQLTTNGISVELSLWGNDGVLKNSVILPEVFTDLPNTVIRTLGDRIYILQANTLAILDTDLNLQKTLFFPGDAYGRMHLTSDGTLYLGGYANSLYHVDLSNGTFVPYEFPDLPAELAEASVHFDIADHLYLAEASGIYQVDGTKYSCVLEWSSGNAKYNNNMDLRVFDENTFAAYAVDPQTFRSSFQKLSSIYIDGEPRRVITLGSAETDNSGHLAAVVFNFNSMSSSYYVEMFDYHEKYQDNVKDGIVEEFLMGNEPDIIVGLGSDIYEALVDKNAFVNLDNQFGDHILGGIRASGMMNGKLSYIPLGMTMTTFLSNRSDDENMTLQTLYEKAAQLGEGQYLFSDPRAGEYVYESGVRAFYDTESQSCSFDSENFCEFIRFTEGLDDRFINTDLGYYNQQHINIPLLTISDPSVRDHLASGTLTYLTATIKDISQLASAKFLLGGEHMSFCGFPTKDGGAYINAFSPISITASSDVQGGAAEFLSYALSKEAMTAQTLTRNFLPTTQDAICALLDEYSYFYYFDDPVAWMPYYTYEGNTQLQSGVQVYTLHQSAVSEIETAKQYGKTDRISEINLTQQDKNHFIEILNSDGMISSFAHDTVISSILEEELSAYRSGGKSLEEAAKLIQSRVGIYLNE